MAGDGKEGWLHSFEHRDTIKKLILHAIHAKTDTEKKKKKMTIKRLVMGHEMVKAELAVRLRLDCAKTFHKYGDVLISP
jgi:hypothetical protein